MAGRRIRWFALSATLLVVTAGPVEAAAARGRASRPIDTISAASLQQTRQPTVEGWRYRWHNGHWWYYQTNKQWLFWNGIGWSAYSPGAYQRFTRRRRYAADYQQMTGPNGPGFSESGEIYQNRD